MAAIPEYESRDALGLAEWVRAGEVTPLELLEAAVERVEERNPALNIVVIRAFEEGRKAIEAGLPDGPLRGVPWLLKDLHGAWKGMPLTSGSRFFAEVVSDYDAEIVTRYRRAGLVLFGRTASPELGLTLDHRVGALRRHAQPLAARALRGWLIGRRRRGRCRGDRPGRERERRRRLDPDSGVVLRAVRPQADTRARSGGPARGRGLERHERDARRHAQRARQRRAARRGGGPRAGRSVLGAAAGRPFLAEVGADPGRLRIAVQSQAFNGAPVDPECAAAARDAADLCRGLGHEVEEAELSIDRELLGKSAGTIISANLRATLLERAAELGRDATPDDVEPLTWGMAEGAKQLTGADYVIALRGIHAIGRAVAAFLERFDLLLTPTMATPPLPIGRLSLSRPDFPGLVADLARTIGFTQLFNASGHPAMSVPLYWSGAGLPIGVQFAARFGDEATLYRLAAQLESARPWFAQRPPLAAG